MAPTGPRWRPCNGGDFDPKFDLVRFHRGGDIVVAKLAPQGNPLLDSTYVGARAATRPGNITVDEQGRAYVVGDTRSPSSPVSEEAFQKTRNGPGDAVVLRFGSEGQLE